MASIELNGECVEAPEGGNLLLAAHTVGVHIPHLCYHPGLSAPVNCRLCVAAVGRGEERRLVPACDVPVSEGLVVDTLADDVAQARAEALEFLLVGHALDCPVCAKAGECELQNYVSAHGRDEGRYAEDAHSHQKTDLGPRIRLYADRCIDCSRCIRFCDEVAQSGELARVDRGEQAHVGVFPGRVLDNPLAGNVVDLCPVGALVEKDAHLGPPVWQLRGVDSICSGCSAGCNVRVDVHREKVIRVKPRFNPEVNDYWLCDGGRYGWQNADEAQRVHHPLIRRGQEFAQVEWDEALAQVDKRMALCEGEAIAASFSANSTNEEAYLFAHLVRDIWRARWVMLRGCQDSEGDQHFGGGFTIRADKTPNARGVADVAAQLAVEFLSPDRIWPEMAEGRVRAAFFLAGHPRERLTEAEREALAGVEFLVVQTAFESELSQMASVVLPGATAFEKTGTFTNVDGRVQCNRRIVLPPGLAWPDWRILSRLGQAAGLHWTYDDPTEIAVALGEQQVAALTEVPEGRSGQVYGGGWATRLQRLGFIHVEDHSKRV
ncbi:MAG TPA: 2Fe-2S iron-sulfur cluster binding domain-containing protein [Candidatus Handelsmanbacteria bacterium]|nr:2Fe-2S iron-sulfur cluster binding domain-containing protein [Candidatus Handelsmanbacteria bacterium]